LGMLGTDQNYIHIEIKSTLRSGNTCYHSVWSLLFSHLLSKKLKIEINRTLLLCDVLYESEIWSLTQMEEHILRVFESRVLRRIFGPKRE